MGRIRQTRMTEREAMWARYGMALAHREDATEAHAIYVDVAEVYCGHAATAVIHDVSVDMRDLALRALRVSRRCSRLRLRGSR